MRKALSIGVVLLAFVLGWIAHNLLGNNENQPTISLPKIIERPLDKYTIENLGKADIAPGKLTLENTLDENKDYSSVLFAFEFNPEVQGKIKKKTTGEINIPKGDGPFPLIVMLRGYIDQKLYKTGDGTRRAGEMFAKNGFITVAPDFLGYGESDGEAGNIFESRFQTYVTVISLLKTIEESNDLKDLHFDHKTTFLWAHSNGGQIALTVLEITGKAYPTVLWAPVSKPFPYSILYYTDDSEDGGKLIRRELSEFEKVYDVDAYSLTNYLDRIQAPLQIHQGGKDDAVPIEWSNNLVEKLKAQQKDVTYFTYPSANHDMRPLWNTVILNDLEFFQKHLE